MPVFPVAEAKSWGPIFAEEFANAPAPYFGVNIFDVPIQHWEAVLKNVRQELEMVKSLGGQSYLWTVRDYGSRKRVLRFLGKGVFPRIYALMPGLIWACS